MEHLEILLKVLPLKLSALREGDEPEVTNPKAHAFWIGLLLGDGCLVKKGYMQIEQASEYLATWMHVQLLALNMLPDDSTVNKKERENKKAGKTYTAYGFATRTYKIEPWDQTFYRRETKNGKEKRRKQIPQNIGELLISPLSLAIWFLGDGWYVDGLVHFAAGSLTPEEVGLLQKCLLTNFGLKTSYSNIDPTKNNGRKIHSIYVIVDSYSQFYSLVNPYLELFEQEVGPWQECSFLKRKILPPPKGKQRTRIRPLKVAG